MTKPITSVAAMMLYEEGAFELKDPIHRYLPEFRHMRVFTGGSAIAPVTVPATEPIRVWHLLTHTAGLTYGFHHAHPVDGIYRKAGFEWGAPADRDLAECCARWAELPLVFEPGSRWNYSVATDVLGRLVEVLSGQTLDAFFAERIFGPLGMTDTSFSVREDDLGRLAALYVPPPGTREILRYDAMGAAITKPPVFLSGGGGLVSTAHDYHRFTEMLRRGGELDGVRLLGPRTVRYMGTNHLPGGVDLEAFGQSTFAETDLRRCRLRARVRGRAGPRSHQGALVGRRDVVGWRRLHRLLRRPGRGHHRGVPHPAAPVEHLRPPFPAQAGVVPSSAADDASPTTMRWPRSPRPASGTRPTKW